MSCKRSTPTSAGVVMRRSPLRANASETVSTWMLMMLLLHLCTLSDEAVLPAFHSSILDWACSRLMSLLSRILSLTSVQTVAAVYKASFWKTSMSAMPGVSGLGCLTLLISDDVRVECLMQPFEMTPPLLVAGLGSCTRPICETSNLGAVAFRV